MYGLDANIIEPPFSALISILLIFGCDLIGFTFISKFLKVNTIENRWIRWQSPIIGVSILAILIYPMALFGFASKNQLSWIAFLLIVFSIINIYLILRFYYADFKVLAYKLYKNFDIRERYLNLIILILITGYGLLALSPVTSSDSLDYHIGVSIEILNSGFIFNTPEWFHSRLAGGGEVLNALGLSVGAEQFGSLLQFVGLLGIFGLIIDVDLPDESAFKRDKELSPILALTLLSAPLLIFLVSSSKFQLIPVSMTTLALCLIIFPSRQNLSRIESIKGFVLVCILLMVASQMKINYFLSGGVIGLIALVLMFREKIIWQSLIIGFLFALIIIAPVVITKSNIYDVGILEVLLSPLPGSLPGLNQFESSIRSAQDTGIIFPFSLIFTSRFGSITTIIGIGVLIVGFIRPKKDKWIVILLTSLLLVFVLTYILGPRSSRSYLEPFLWSLIAISLQTDNSLFFKFKVFIKSVVTLQSILVIILCWYGVVLLSPGSLSSMWRNNVMNHSANGYEIMQWANQVLPSNSVLLSAHRSMGLVPRKAVALDWLFYIDPDIDDISKYVQKIKAKKITHILLYESQINQNALHYKLFYNCINSKKSSLIHKRKFVNRTRNPFNTGSSNTIYIYEFDSEKLPECMFSNYKSNE
jgi:hypothetical protein